jgi:hypothetical protein
MDVPDFQSWKFFQFKDFPVFSRPVDTLMRDLVGRLVQLKNWRT